jgi:hypothetical protein
MDAEQSEPWESLFDQLEDARRKRDAAGRLCARAVVAGNIESAQWQAQSFQAFSDQVESLRIEMNQDAPAPK